MCLQRAGGVSMGIKQSEICSGDSHIDQSDLSKTFKTVVEERKESRALEFVDILCASENRSRAALGDVSRRRYLNSPGPNPADQK